MKYYLTYYEAYPIYEPAEGGYYYEGCSAEEWMYCDKEDSDEAFAEMFANISEAIDRYELEDLNITKKELIKWIKKDGWDNIMVAIDRSKYIGDNRYLYFETENGFKGEERGWHPYE